MPDILILVIFPWRSFGDFPMEIHSFFTGNSLGPICNGSKVGIAYKTRVGMGLNSLMLGIGVYQQLGPEIICWWENTITIDHIWLDKSSCSSLAHLVGGFNHSENYESQLGLLFFPLYGKITAIVPTHQPVIILFREYGCPSLHRSRPFATGRMDGMALYGMDQIKGTFKKSKVPWNPCVNPIKKNKHKPS